MRKRTHKTTSEVGCASPVPGTLPQQTENRLRQIVDKYSLSLDSGDVLQLASGCYVTHAGLLKIARQSRCAGIHVQAVPQFCAPNAQRWAFKAIVYKSKMCRGFVGYGDADPSNVSFLVHGGGNAGCRDACGQSRTAQSLRNRHLLGRGDRLVCRTGSVLP